MDYRPDGSTGGMGALRREGWQRELDGVTFVQVRRSMDFLWGMLRVWRIAK